METLTELNKKIEEELKLIKAEMGVEQLELKKEQNILFLLTKFRNVLNRISNAHDMPFIYNMNLYHQRHNLDMATKAIGEMITTLKEDEKVITIIAQEDRAQIKEIQVGNNLRLKDIPLGGHTPIHSKSQIEAMREFKIMRRIEQQKEGFTKKHKWNLESIKMNLKEIVKRLKESETLETSPHPKPLVSVAPAAFQLLKELGHYFGQLHALFIKEEYIIELEEKLLK